MKQFSLVLQDATHNQQIDGVTSFVGEDSSGSFGILAGHDRLITALVIGLARFRVGDGDWQYLAVPGGILYFQDNVLTLSTRHYLLDNDYNRISQALQQQLLAEEEQLHAMKSSLHRMEEEVLKRLWELSAKNGNLSHDAIR
ncbi:F0F1 ATP synthase subunit epsilon [Porticoccus litoralis]|uniref:ATP synthase epsilon chain n=1 Tax=Porticoccus litoralis TaxID=434086 RepID=A0AAW8B432_9GAMM|nr:F0F1 ATP synthase subunit epsilon [Porticoccus litoralis]MDP1519883.1 F0F1 ATP synthase subunit epsilon [Porticoccus litoralis]